MQLVRARCSFSQACVAASRDMPVSRARYSTPWGWRTDVTLERAPPSISRAWSRAAAVADDARPSFANAPTCTAQAPGATVQGKHVDVSGPVPANITPDGVSLYVENLDVRIRYFLQIHTE